MSTACALLAGAECGPDPRTAASRADRGLDWLRAEQAGDGGLRAAPFIRMEVGRASGHTVKTLSHGSRTISTLLALKAAVAWQRIQALPVG